MKTTKKERKIVKELIKKLKKLNEYCGILIAINIVISLINLIVVLYGL